MALQQQQQQQQQQHHAAAAAVAQPPLQQHQPQQQQQQQQWSSFPSSTHGVGSQHGGGAPYVMPTTVHVPLGALGHAATMPTHSVPLHQPFQTAGSWGASSHAHSSAAPTVLTTPGSAVLSSAGGGGSGGDSGFGSWDAFASDPFDPFAEAGGAAAARPRSDGKAVDSDSTRLLIPSPSQVDDFNPFASPKAH